jgi:hypothetical protein
LTKLLREEEFENYEQAKVTDVLLGTIIMHISIWWKMKKNVGINKSFGWTMKMVRSRDNKNPISLVFTIIQPENSYVLYQWGEAGEKVVLPVVWGGKETRPTG